MKRKTSWLDLMTGRAWERGQLYSGQPVRDIAIFNNAANPGAAP